MRILIAAFLCLVLTTAWAQGEQNSLKGTPVEDRLVFGMGIGGLSFSQTTDFIGLQPSVGYMLTRRLLGGASFTYRYTKYKTNPPQNFHDYGVAPFLRFLVTRNIFLHTEYEYLNYDFTDYRRSFESFIAGGGFVQPIGNKGAFYMMALYNFSYADPVAGQYSPYTSPLIIRVGVNAGMFGIGL
jgi:hypothetical protein